MKKKKNSYSSSKGLRMRTASPWSCARGTWFIKRVRKKTRLPRRTRRRCRPAAAGWCDQKSQGANRSDGDIRDVSYCVYIIIASRAVRKKLESVWGRGGKKNVRRLTFSRVYCLRRRRNHANDLHGRFSMNFFSLFFFLTIMFFILSHFTRPK